MSDSSPKLDSQPDNQFFLDALNELPTANSSPGFSGTIRNTHSDFEVSEALSFEPSGEGEHLFLYIEKQQCNTSWVAEQLQKHFRLRSQDIGYAGKKDKCSIAKQWFSLHIPGQSVSIDDLDTDSFRVIKAVRHNKKLRKGVIQHNHFKIKVINLAQAIDERVIDNIRIKGFPNYFGYQRFGHNANNLIKASKLFNQQIKVRSRNKRGLYLSAARSFLFNLMLAQRLEKNLWEHIVPGDCVGLSGSKSYFVCDKIDDELKQRLAQADIHISGWLAGIQKSQSESKALELETSVLAQYESWLVGLKNAKVASSRRPMRVIPQDFKISQFNDNQQLIEFSLPAGSFATSLLRELFVINDAALNFNELKTGSE